jgi:hypothetical protein
MARLLRLVLLGVLVALLVGCGGGGGGEYDGDFEAGFLEACNAAVGDGKGAVCQCTYDQLRDTVPFERAERLDRRLRDDPESVLPDDVADLIAGCVAHSVPPSIATTTTSTTAAAGATTTTTAATDGSTTTTTVEAG